MISNLKALILSTSMNDVPSTIRSVQDWQGRIATLADAVFINGLSVPAIVVALNELAMSNQIVEIELAELLKILPKLDSDDLGHRLHWIHTDIRRVEDCLRTLGELLKPVSEPWAMPIKAEIETLLA